MVWKAHKAVVQGALIRIEACLKWERTCHMEELLAQVHSLECSHKASLVRSTYQDFLKVCEELCSLLFHKTKPLAWAQCMNFQTNLVHCWLEHCKARARKLTFPIS